MRTAAALLLSFVLAACSLGLDGFSGGQPATPDSGDAASSLPDGASVGASDGSSTPNEAGVDAGTATFVQSAVGETEALTFKLPFTNAVAEHDTLIVGFITDDNATAKNVTDSLGNTFTRVAGPASFLDLNSYLYVAYDVKGGSDMITVAVDGGNPPPVIAATADEYSGLRPNGLDIAGSSDDATGATAASLQLNTTQPNTLLYGYAYAGTENGDGTMVAGSGFSPHASGNGQMTEGRMLSQAGHQTITATMTTGLGWVLLGAAFTTQ